MEFNPQQKAIIEFDERFADGSPRSLAVLAGPGSGKTATIVERVSHQVASGSAPNTLMLTFSRKAAQEMFGRLIGRCWGDEPPPWYREKMPLITTFHGFGWWLIRQSPTLFGYQPDALPTIIDNADQLALLKQIPEVPSDKARLVRDALDKVSAEGIFFTEKRREQIVEFVEQAYDGWESFLGMHPSLFAMKAADAAIQYQALKRKSRVIDFNDLQAFLVYVLERAVQTGQGRELLPLYNEIIVDEAQDTNYVQYRIAAALARLNQGASRIVMVGDDDQSIYGWRGARHENIARFVEEFDACTLPLVINYRSAPEIVEHATRLIEHNAARFEKKPESARKQAQGELSPWGFGREREMGEWLVKDIQSRIQAGARYGDIAILTRTNAMVSLVERHLLSAGIPYGVHKGVELLNKKEVQMALAAVRLILNPDDELAFRKVVDAIPGVGEKAIQEVLLHHTLMQQSGQSMGIIEDYASTHENRISEKLTAVFMRTAEMVLQGPAQQCFTHLLTDEDSPFYVWFKKLCAKSNAPDKCAEMRKQALDALSFAAMKALQDAGLSKEATPVEKWYEALSVMLTGGEAYDEQNQVTLSTAHRAKGLEWQEVYVYGASEGLFPMKSRNAGLEDELASDLEEERRLMYVAMTRAKDRLVMLHASEIDMPGIKGEYRPSKFIFESGLSLREKTCTSVKNRQVYGGQSRSRLKAIDFSRIADAQSGMDSKKNEITESQTHDFF